MHLFGEIQIQSPYL